MKSTAILRRLYLKILLIILFQIGIQKIICIGQNPITVFSVENQVNPITGLPASPEEFIAATLVGSGVTIENIQVTGDFKACGAFVNNNDPATTKFEFDKGIVLSTGCWEDVPGPNDKIVGDSPEDCGIVSPGDDDLKNLASVATKDAIVIEFEFTTVGEIISFNYIFASEEYEEYVCGKFNDVFGFFISGPNPDPAGQPYDKKNIAVIPNTETAISVSTINAGIAQQFDGNVCELGNSQYFVGSIPELQYEGKTVSLTASVAVNPCEKYTLKLGIADGFDNGWDSGVFLQAGSIFSPEPVISQTGGYIPYEVDANGDVILDSNGNPVPSYTDENNEPVGVLLESCGEKELIFSIDNLAPSSMAKLKISFSGTAENGVDYTDLFGNPIPTEIFLSSDEPSDTIDLVAVIDNITEGTETIIVIIEEINDKQCLVGGNLKPDTLYISDQLVDVLPSVPEVTDIFPFDPKCTGSVVAKFKDLIGFDSVKYFPPQPIIDRGSDPNSPTNVEAFVEETTIFKVQLFNGVCIDTILLDTVKIIKPNLPCPPNINTIYSVCTSGPVKFNLPLGNTYEWPNNLGLDCIDCNDPTYSQVGVNADFDLKVTYDVDCSLDTTFNIKITYDDDSFLLGPTDPIFICGDETKSVEISGGEKYQWLPNTGISCDTCAKTEISASSVTNYQIAALNSFGCPDTFTLNVFARSSIAFAGPDTGNCGIVNNLELGQDSYPPNYKFSWSPSTGLSNDTLPNPTVYLETQNGNDQIIEYILTVESPEGCIDHDTLVLTAEIEQPISIAQGDSVTLIIGNSVPLNVSGLNSTGSYSWTPETGLNLRSGSSVIAKPIESTDYIVTGTSQFGCKTSDTISVTVIEPPSLKWPTAFSPNNDGLNDLFRFQTKDVEEIYSFKIMNRWGKIVYNGSENNFAGWDGFTNGLPQAMGVYVFAVEFLLEGESSEQTSLGHFTLIR